MKKHIAIIGILVFLSGCLTTTEQPQNQLAVIETWSGYAIGKGSECSDFDMKIKLLEDNSIVGTAHTVEYNKVFRLKGTVSKDMGFYMTGSESGGIQITLKGNVTGNSASGTWNSSWPGCLGTWEAAKVSP